MKIITSSLLVLGLLAVQQPMLLFVLVAFIGPDALDHMAQP